MKLIILLFFSAGILYPQQFQPKQITDFNFDSVNPVFLQYPFNIPWFSQETEFFFEAVYNDSLSSICLLKYDQVSDSFFQFTELTPVIDSNVIHRKAEGRLIENYPGTPFKIVLWETDENGNWDIAFSVDSGNGWTGYDLLLSSAEDELDPSFIVDLFMYNYQAQFQFLYSKGNSVFFFSIEDSVQNEILFEGNDSVKYSDPTGAYSSFDGNLYAVAVEEKRGEHPKLLYRMKQWQSNIWGEIMTVFDRVHSSKPKFVNAGWSDTYLSFEVSAERIKKIVLIRPEDFGIAGTAIALMVDPLVETSDFSSFTFGIITEEPEDDFYSYLPFSFGFRRNDSTYIRTGVNYYYTYPYTDIYTKVTAARSNVGPLSVMWEGVLSYTIWEDSSNGRINLFGLRRIDSLGDVKDKGTAEKFDLFQNYPNPFNSNTIISYRLTVSSRVILKVYDVLGREAATLVNEEKSPGVYEVEFDASSAAGGLSGGIYFYRLHTENYSVTKKMIYLK